MQTPTFYRSHLLWTMLPIVVGCLLLPLPSSLSSSLSSSAIAQELPSTKANLPKMLRTLTVIGKGYEAIPTTLTKVQLGVTAQGKTANEVQQAVARRSNAVVTLLRSRQVEKLETTGIQLNPIYRYTNNTQQISGYSATNNVSFRLPTAQAGTLLDDAVKAGASQIDSVSFIAADDAIAAAQKQALRKATQDAQAQADAVFSALNLTRKDIVNIQINDATAPVPIVTRAEAAMELSAAKAAPSPVLGAEQRVEGTVTLQISY